jgi:hypothetical protein
VGVGLLVVVPLICWFWFMRLGPNPQWLQVKNEFESARCVMDFTHGQREVFSIRKGGTHRRFYRGPREGFVLIRCEGETKAFETPAHFHFIKGGRAEVLFTGAGKVEVEYVFRDEMKR